MQLLVAVVSTVYCLPLSPLPVPLRQRLRACPFLLGWVIFEILDLPDSCFTPRTMTEMLATRQLNTKGILIISSTASSVDSNERWRYVLMDYSAIVLLIISKPEQPIRDLLRQVNTPNSRQIYYHVSTLSNKHAKYLTL
jgi:hypothetical protein